LIRPAEDNFDKSVLRDARVLAMLHKAKIVYFLNHEDCGAYEKFSSRESEIKQHIEDLYKARDIILEKFPKGIVKLYFVELETGTDDVFNIKEVV